MPELTTSGAVDVVQRQVRRVRRRKNLYELQRTLYLTIAACAVAATILLPLALFAATDVFAIAAAGMLVILAGIALGLAGTVRRRWLGRAAAVPWIEMRGGLAGRLRTLLELAARPSAAPGFFHPLLVTQVTTDVARWAPRRLVPRGIPRGALGSACVAVAVLMLVFQLASLAVPAAPDVAFANSPLTGTRVPDSAPGAQGERVVVAPGVPQPHDDGRPAAGHGDGDGDGSGDDSSLTSLPSALQENVRQQVWGKAWERVRDALARAGTSGGNGTGGTPTDSAAEYGAESGADGADQEWEMARGPSGELSRRRRPGVGKQPAEHGDDPVDADQEARANAGKSEQDGGDGSGAGDGTSPNLFGPPTVDTEPATGAFELALAARMRADRVANRRVNGKAPDADPDAQPELGADQRRESAAHRMAVPAAYETVVREVFAHRRAEPEQP